MKNNSDILNDSHIEYFTNEKQTQTSRKKTFKLPQIQQRTKVNTNNSYDYG